MRATTSRTTLLLARLLLARLLLAGFVLTVAAACSGSQQVVSGDGPVREPTTVPEEPGTGDSGGTSGGLVVSVEVGGGFLLAGQDFRTVPHAVVYDDGTTLSPGATIAIYPGPALPAVSEGHLDEATVDALLDAAAQAGLTDGEEEDFGEPPIADAATTAITVVVDGETHVTSVYALGVSGGLDEELPGLTPEQRQARDRVGAFVELVSSRVAAVVGEPYVAERLRVLPLVPGEVDPAVEPDTRDWPLPDIALQESECIAVDGEQAEELRVAVDQASEITRWRTDSGESFVLAVRPVLPHEPGCPE